MYVHRVKCLLLFGCGAVRCALRVFRIGARRGRTSHPFFSKRTTVGLHLPHPFTGPTTGSGGSMSQKSPHQHSRRFRPGRAKSSARPTLRRSSFGSKRVTGNGMAANSTALWSTKTCTKRWSPDRHRSSSQTVRLETGSQCRIPAQGTGRGIPPPCGEAHLYSSSPNHNARVRTQRGRHEPGGDSYWHCGAMTPQGLSIADFAERMPGSTRTVGARTGASALIADPQSNPCQADGQELLLVAYPTR